MIKHISRDYTQFLTTSQSLLCFLCFNNTTWLYCTYAMRTSGVTLMLLILNIDSSVKSLQLRIWYRRRITTKDVKFLIVSHSSYTFNSTISVVVNQTVAHYSNINHLNRVYNLNIFALDFCVWKLLQTNSIYLYFLNFMHLWALSQLSYLYSLPIIPTVRGIANRPKKSLFLINSLKIWWNMRRS